MKSTRVIAVLVGLALGNTPVPVLAASAAPADPCHLPGGILQLSDLEGRSAVACGAVGRTIDIGNGVTLPVRSPGHSVTLGMLYPDGHHTYSLTTDASGVVTANAQEVTATDFLAQESDAGQGPAEPTKKDKEEEFPDTPGPGACERDSFVLAGFKWYKPWLFRTTTGSTLAGGTQADFDAAARRATRNMTNIRNTCGIRGGTTAAGAFVGHTAKHGNFIVEEDQYTCGNPDAENVLDTGDLPGGFLEAVLAAFCVWSENRGGVHRAVSADLRFNNGDYNWTYNPNDPSCDGEFPPDPDRWRYDVESVMTHEAGHVFGLVNLSDIEDINQTMFPGIRRCSGHFRTLGLGDTLGMLALYGPPGRR